MSVRKLDVPGPKAQAILARDAAHISPRIRATSRSSSSAARGPRSGTSTATATSTSPPASRSARPVTAIPRSCARSRTRPRSSSTSPPTTITSSGSRSPKRSTGSRRSRRTPWSSSPTPAPRAVEAAIKLARYHTKRPRFIGFYGGFHGRTMGALAFTSSKITQRRGFFPMMPGVTHVPYPDPYRPRWRSTAATSDIGQAVVDYLEEVVFVHDVPPDEVAAILVEPIQGEGGYVVPPASFFPRLRAALRSARHPADRRRGAVGRWAAPASGGRSSTGGVEPDIVTSAKGIASGVPLGAMIAKTVGGDLGPGARTATPTAATRSACASALATIGVIESGGTRERGGGRRTTALGCCELAGATRRSATCAARG